MSREGGTVLDKLAAAAPGRLTGAGRLREVVHVDRRGWFAQRPDVAHLPELRQAATERRRVRIGYRSPRDDAPRQRTLDPLGLVENAGRWYLVAFHRGESRTYRVTRISSVTLLAEPARLPADATLAQVWEQTRAGFEDRKPPDAVVRLLVDDASESSLRTVLEPMLAPGHRIDVVDRAPAGVVLEGTFRVGLSVVGCCLAFGGAAEVLAPPELRRTALVAATAAVARMSGAAGTS